MVNNVITQDRLKDLLHYDPEEGLFTWRVANSKRVRVGAVAGCIKKGGYIGLKIDGKDYLAHRLAFFYMTGSFPKDQIDHINMNSSDNRFCNLREATHSENMCNSAVFKNNKLGIKGVCLSHGKYQARLPINGKVKYLGWFVTKELASAAYQKAAKKLHGEFYCDKGVNNAN